MRTTRAERTAYAAIAALFIALFVADAAMTVPYVHDECFSYIPFYGTSGGGGIGRELTKVFDACRNEGCLPRPRPLNNLLELIDAKLLGPLNAWMPWGIRSITYPLLILSALAPFALALSSLLPGVGTAYRWMLAAFFGVTTQAMVLNGAYFRPAKALAAAATAAVLALWARNRNQPTSDLTERPMRYLALGVLLGLLTLSDEQVVVAQGLFLALTALHWKKSGKGLPFAASLLGALGFYALYSRVLHPWLITHLTTSVPAGFDSYFDPKPLWHLTLRAFWQALQLNLYQLRLILGNAVDGWLLGAVIGGAAIVVSFFRWRGRGAGPLRIFAALTFAALVASTYLQTHVFKQHMQYAAEGRRSGYYFLPSVLLLLAALYSLWRAGGLFGSARWRNGIAAILFFCGIANFLSVARTREIAWSGHLAETRRQNELLRAAWAGDAGAQKEVEKLPEAARNFHRYWMEITRN